MKEISFELKQNEYIEAVLLSFSSKPSIVYYILAFFLILSLITQSQSVIFWIISLGIVGFIDYFALNIIRRRSAKLRYKSHENDLIGPYNLRFQNDSLIYSFRSSIIEFKWNDVQEKLSNSTVIILFLIQNIKIALPRNILDDELKEVLRNKLNMYLM